MSFSGDEQGISALTTAKVKNLAIVFVKCVEEFDKFLKWRSADVSLLLG